MTCPRHADNCPCLTEFPGSAGCQVCKYLAEHPDGYQPPQDRAPVATRKEKTPPMDITSFAEGRREVRRFIESHPELFNGSVEVEGVTDPNVAEYIFLTSAVADACHEAALEVAARFNLDMRDRADYAESYRLLAQEDDSWSAASFDELSAAAQDRVLRTARKKMARHTNGGFYGRPTREQHVVMDDQFKHDREAHMRAVAARDHLDLSTVDGRSIAYQRAADEHPHLRVPVGRGRQHRGVPQLALRRGQPATGEPVGPGLTKVGPHNPNRPFSEHVDPQNPVPAPRTAENGTSGAGGVGGRIF
jgi:hypothetical protein